MTLQDLNTGNAAAVAEALKQCCGSGAWVERMIGLRPFASQTALLSKAATVWKSLAPADWLEAFAHHPKIGEKSAAKWSSEEQHGMQEASTDTAAAMDQLNIDYEQKFGWIFIVCATGKTAGEMLALIAARLRNDPAAELTVAACEQAKITKLRLEKLLAQ